MRVNHCTWSVPIHSKKTFDPRKRAPVGGWGSKTAFERHGNSHPSVFGEDEMFKLPSYEIWLGVSLLILSSLRKSLGNNRPRLESFGVMHAIIFNRFISTWAKSESPANSFQTNIDKVEYDIGAFFQILWMWKMGVLWALGWKHWYEKSVTKVHQVLTLQKARRRGTSGVWGKIAWGLFLTASNWNGMFRPMMAKVGCTSVRSVEMFSTIQSLWEATRTTQHCVSQVSSWIKALTKIPPGGVNIMMRIPGLGDICPHLTYWQN